MIYPLKKWKTAKRGYRFGEKTFYSPRHLGVDHIVPEGTPVFAPIDCEIVVAFRGPQGGNQVHVFFTDSQYGPLLMRCMHLKDLSRPLGKYKEGDIIGITGNTGKFTKGAHLHTDISKGELKLKDFSNFIDPEKYFEEKI